LKDYYLDIQYLLDKANVIDDVLSQKTLAAIYSKELIQELQKMEIQLVVSSEEKGAQLSQMQIQYSMKDRILKAMSLYSFIVALIENVKKGETMSFTAKDDLLFINN